VLTWFAVDMRTGVVLADLPTLSADTLSVVLGAYSTTIATLPIVDAPVDWERATLHGGSVLVLADDPGDGTVPTVLWGGFAVQRTRTSGDTISVSLATLEAYLDRRFVGDKTYTATGQNSIVEDIVTTYVADTLPITVVKMDGAGTTRDRTYADSDDKSVLSVLNELAAVQGGPEWTIGWTWTNGTTTTVTPVLYVGSRVGAAATAGLDPAATFEMPGAVTSAEFTEDFTSGNGATSVIAVSTASTDTRPQSPAQTSGDVVRPTFEHRFTPSTSISSTTTLTEHAARAVASMANGARTLKLTAAWDEAPVLGTDWSLGDDVAYVIGGLVADPTTTTAYDLYIDTYTDVYGATGTVLAHPNGLPSVPAFGAGLSGTARCIGWELTLAEPKTVSPILILEA